MSQNEPKEPMSDKPEGTIDERLEVLSDSVRRGIPISMYEAFEVIDYQSARRSRSWFQKIKEWFK